MEKIKVVYVKLFENTTKEYSYRCEVLAKTGDLAIVPIRGKLREVLVERTAELLPQELGFPVEALKTVFQIVPKEVLPEYLLKIKQMEEESGNNG